MQSDQINTVRNRKSKVVDGHIRMGINSELTDVENGFKIASSFSRFNHLLVIIPECDPVRYVAFRDLVTNEIDKPKMNIFRMFGMMSSKFVYCTDPSKLKTDSLVKKGVHGDHSDIGVRLTKNDHSTSVMIWNYDDDVVAGLPAKVIVRVNNLPDKHVLLHHNNAYQKWVGMGKSSKDDTGAIPIA